MAKEYKTVHKYAVSAAKLYQSFTDEQQIKTKYEQIGARNVAVTTASATNVETSREVAADVPKILAKFAGEWNTIQQTENWQQQNGSYIADLDIDLIGIPVDIKGSLHIEPTGEDSCTNTVSMKVKCSIPIIGGKAESFVLGDTKKQIENEYQYLKSNLKK